MVVLIRLKPMGLASYSAKSPLSRRRDSLRFSSRVDLNELFCMVARIKCLKGEASIREQWHNTCTRQPKFFGQKCSQGSWNRRRRDAKRGAPGTTRKKGRMFMFDILKARPALALALLASVFLTALPEAWADSTVTFSLANVTFQDGSTATGTFTVDETVSTVTQWNITYVGGPAGVPSQVFTTGNVYSSYSPGPSIPPQIDFVDNPTPSTTEGINIILSAPLANIADPILINTPSNYATYTVFYQCTSGCPGNTYTDLASTTASAVPTAAPEPSTFVLLFVGLAALAAILAHRAEPTARPLSLID
jgi:hypothetical protein